MRLLTRYIIREMIGPTLLGFGFYTFVIVMRSLFDLAEMIIKRSLPFTMVLKLLAYSLPHIVVLTIPMSLLFGILIAIGRLSADSEIIAMRSAGLPTSAIYRPVFYFSFAVFLINLYLMNVVLPLGNSAFQELRSEIYTSPTISGALKPRVFFDQFAGRVIYVNDIARDGTWRGVFMSDETSAEQQRIIVAERGDISFTKLTKQLWLNLYNSETHMSAASKADRYDLNRNASQRFLLIDRLADADKNKSSVRSYREFTFLELWREHGRAKDPIDQRITLVELQKKLSIPFACLAFGIVALPLGITNRRGGKSSGFSLSIGIILLYYIALNNGEDMAISGQIHPVVAMWLPNLILVAVGIFLITRANSDAGTAARTGGLRRLFSKVENAILRRRRAPSREDVEGEPSLLSRLDIPFPNTLDRYVLREYTKILLMVLVSTAVLFLIVDYTEIAGDINTNHIAPSVVLSYYRYFVLQVVNWTLPLSVLLATLVTFGIFSSNNEVTAIKANGISLYRIALPVVVIAGIVSVISYFLLDFVLPFSNERVNQLRDQIKGKQTARSFSIEQRQWLFGEGNANGRHLFNFLSYDQNRHELSQVQVFEFDPARFKLTRRIYADAARWDGSGWWFTKGWIRSFDSDGSSSYTPILQPIKLQYRERPEYFATEVKLPTQMSYVELSRYIANLKRSGYSSDELVVKLYQKTSEPFVGLVMVLIALPFAFRIGKRGALYGVGIAIFLAFVYYGFYVGFTKFGEIGNLPAILSAWSANILFAIAAVYLFLRVET
jgi:LPS export ABC transporter permease LptG/LPS export ABC transporter permease LptF